jgi:hypothetical protein
LIVFASGSSSTAPETDGANFLSGKSMRANCGLKAPAQSERSSDVLELCLFSDAKPAGDEGMNESSRREVRYCVRFEAMSFNVWYDRKLSEHQFLISPCRILFNV